MQVPHSGEHTADSMQYDPLLIARLVTCAREPLPPLKIALHQPLYPWTVQESYEP